MSKDDNNTDKSDYLKHLDCVVNEIAESTARPDPFAWVPDENGCMSKMFNRAFKLGGLDEVDALIEMINSKLLAKKTRFVLKSGVACAMSIGGEPESLMVYYQRPEGNTPVFNQWISLEQGVPSLASG